MDTRDPGNHAAIRTQIGMIFQRPQDQIVATTVEEDVAFGPGNLGLPADEIRSRVTFALSASSLSDYRNRPSYLLSAGETQRLTLAGLLAMRLLCLIIDETTVMLDPAGREMVLKQAKALHQQGADHSINYAPYGRSRTSRTGDRNGQGKNRYGRLPPSGIQPER